MSNIGSSYSQIIQPEDYNRIMTEEHLYISTSDMYIAKKIKELTQPAAEVVELGCGPARVLSLISENQEINLTAIELDEGFLEYAKKLVKNPNVSFINEDVENYQHSKPVDIFYSQGFHHHIQKGQKTANYLKNIYDNLKDGGYYIISDEFIPNYTDDNDREIKIVIWYSHIIANAIKRGFSYLAQEESKTLLDDLYEGRTTANIKSPEQIDFTLSKVTAIDNAARGGDLETAITLAKEFLTQLESYYNITFHDDTTIDLTRGDFKVCESVLRKEAEMANFHVESIRSFGPIETIGAMSVYLLKKIA